MSLTKRYSEADCLSRIVLFPHFVRARFAPSNRLAELERWAEIHMNADHWTETILRLHSLRPAFSDFIRKSHDISFDNVMRVLSGTPQRTRGFDLPDEPSDSAILRTLLGLADLHPSGEVLVIPDCGDRTRPSFTCDAASLSFVLDNYSAPSTGWGIFDGCSDVLFVFSNGAVLFVDHDERCWLNDVEPR